MMKITRAFTLPEVLLSIALLTIITGMTIPLYGVFMNRNDLDTATTMIAQNLRRAQALSESGDGDTSWGVHVGVGSILVFKGASYVSRDSTYDESTSYPTTIVPTGLSEVVFSKVTGAPQVTGAFTLTAPSGEVRNITINEKGMVDY